MSAGVRKLFAGGVVGLAIGTVAAVAAWTRPPALERGELWTYDVRVRASAAARTDAAARDIVVVDLDDDSIEAAETNLEVSWPWPRALYGYLTDYVTRAGARAVVFDFIFQDRGSYGAGDTEELAKSFTKSGRAVFGLVLTRAEGPPPRRDEGRFGAELPRRFPTREEAVSAALALTGWNVRAYVVEDAGAFRVLWGGKRSADEVLARWRVLADKARSQVAELFAPTPDAEPPEPGARALTDGELAGAVSPERIIAERDGLTLPLPDGTTVTAMRGLDPPLPQLAAAPARLGNVIQDNETDGIIRRHAPLVAHDGRLYPSLPLAAYLVAHPGAAPRVEAGALVLDAAHRIPLDEEGKFAIRYHGGERAYPHLPFYEVLRSQALLDEGKPPSLPPDTFKGKYVIVSATAHSLRDVRVSPVARLHLGADIHANALDNLEHPHDVVRRVSPAVDAALALALCLALALAVVALWNAIPHAALALVATTGATAGVIGGYWLAASSAYATHGLWLAVATPTTAAGATAFASLLVTGAVERRGRRFVQEALGRYTSSELVKELMAHPEYLSLEWGERREMTVYFSDIAGFTTISEKLAPEVLVRLLNDYLTNMTDLVLAHGGVVDKYIGDAVMAFWGAPLANPRHAEQAVRCAIAMRRRCEELRAGWERDYGVTVTARAGLNSGQAVVGNMGSRHKYNYTVMGDMVNLASRLEGANKPYGTFLMVSEFTRERVAGVVDCRELDYMTVKGKDQPVRVFEVLDETGRTDARAHAAAMAFEAGLAKYRARQFEAAIVDFQRAVETNDDPPAKMYIDRCRHFLAEPPGEGWDGVWHMKEK